MAEVNWLQPSNFRPAAVRALPGAASERMGRSAQAHERTGKAARQYTFEPRRADNDGTELTYKYKSLKLTGYAASERRRATMTKTKPRGPTPSLIGGTNGKPRRAAVLRKSSCYRCQDDLVAGTDCIEIPKLGGGYSTVKRVCDQCYAGIIQKTAEDLEALKTL